MPLRARRMIEYFCPLCGHTQPQKPLTNVCPSCRDRGSSVGWAYEDKLDQARADSLEGGE